MEITETMTLIKIICCVYCVHSDCWFLFSPTILFRAFPNRFFLPGARDDLMAIVGDGGEAGGRRPRTAGNGGDAVIAQTVPPRRLAVFWAMGQEHTGRARATERGRRIARICGAQV